MFTSRRAVLTASIVSALVLACGLPQNAVVLAAPAPTATAGDRPIADQWMASIPDAKLGEVMGFYEGRSFMVKLLSDRYPELKAQAAKDGAAFVAAFKPSFDAMMDEAERREPALRKQWNEMIVPKIAEATDQNKWTKDESAKELEAGVLVPTKQPIEMRAIFCAFHPAYRAEPMKEITDGFVTRSAAPIASNDGHQVVVQHPVSWADITSEAEGKKLVQLSSGVGAGPLLLRVEAVAVEDAKPNAEALKQFLTMYGAHESDSVKVGPVSVIHEGTMATRDIHGTVKMAEGTLHTLGTQHAIIKDKTLVLVYISAYVTQKAGEPEPKASELAELLVRAEPVLENLFKTLEVSAK